MEMPWSGSQPDREKLSANTLCSLTFKQEVNMNITQKWIERFRLFRQMHKPTISTIQARHIIECIRNRETRR